MTEPAISVVIPTQNREALLANMLASLEVQTLSTDHFEVVVVDDGSTDGTADVCVSLAEAGQIRYRRTSPGGIGQAKNFGLLAARGRVLLFLDDDDVAASDLLERHLEMHDRYPDDGIAILGYTTWAPSVTITPLMRYVTEIGHQLFAYPLAEDVPLSYHHFWGGRTSCKRQFLLDHGIFNPAFTSIIEDVELGYRLAPAGLTVLHTRRAVTEMARALSFDEFCNRCIRRGHALALFAALHPDVVVEEFCNSDGALERWNAARPLLEEKVARVRELEPQAENGPEALSELYDLYGWAFDAFQLNGMVEAGGGDGDGLLKSSSPPSSVVPFEADS